MSQHDHVLITQQDRVMTIAWNRPDKKNALTQVMYGMAADALISAKTDDSIRVVLLTGTEDCFTSGNDLNDFLNNPASDESAPVARFLAELIRFEKPIIAAVNGPAIGVGTTMLLHCDMVVAADSTIFALPFAKLGLCPEAGSSYLLPAIAGHQRAAELLLLGDNFDASQARDCGIVNRVTGASDYKVVAASMAAQLAAMPPNSIRISKALLKGDTVEKAEAAFREEMKSFGTLLGGAEAIEAMTAFMERRAPDFSKF